MIRNVVIVNKVPQKFQRSTGEVLKQYREYYRHKTGSFEISNL